jgi:hypothetical protein
LSSERAGEMSLNFSVGTDGRLQLTANTPTGKQAQIIFSTGDMNDEQQAKLLAESPLPGEDGPQPSSPSGLFRGIKRLFGSR